MIRDCVIQTICDLLEEDGFQVPNLGDDTILLKTDLDSLGFAVLVARLEDQLGYDPFTSLESAMYPRTLGEMVAIYENHQKNL